MARSQPSFVAVELLRPKLRNYDSDLLDRIPTRPQWPCILCTYLNDNNWSKCELCLTPRTVVRLPLKRKHKKKPKRSKSVIPRRSFLKSLQSSISTELNEEHIVAQEAIHPPPATKHIFKHRTNTRKHHKKGKSTPNKGKYTKPKRKPKLYPLPAATYDGMRPSTACIYGATNFCIAQCVYGELKSALKHRNKSLIALEKREKSVQNHESTLLEILKYCVMGNDVINTISVARCDVLCHFLPLIAFTLCQCDKFEFKMKLLNQLRNRIVGQSDVHQSVKFFINSYYEIESVKSVFNGICNDDNDDKDPITFWFNIVKRKDICENESIKIPLNTVLRDPVKQLSSPIHRIVIKKVINSNSKPLLIDCYGSDTTFKGYLSSTFILKYGDDLRKDKSCMLVFKWINHLFIKSKKLKNVKILTYNVIPMSKLFGCIELIPDCIPLRNILYLESDINSKSKLLTNLISSSVGSYISSYIMGVRDRHFDNILIRRTDCTLFHIDMGYVLGDTITGLDANKFGITKEFYDILGADNYKIFIDLCINAFQELRHYHQELINFACLAFSYVYDYAIIRQYITKQLRMNESDKKASLWLKTQLINAPFNKQTILKNVIHKYATR